MGWRVRGCGSRMVVDIDVRYAMKWGISKREDKYRDFTDVVDLSKNGCFNGG